MSIIKAVLIQILYKPLGTRSTAEEKYDYIRETVFSIVTHQVIVYSHERKQYPHECVRSIASLHDTPITFREDLSHALTHEFGIPITIADITRSKTVAGISGYIYRTIHTDTPASNST